MIDGFYQQAAGDGLLQWAQDVQCSHQNKLQMDIFQNIQSCSSWHGGCEKSQQAEVNRQK